MRLAVPLWTFFFFKFHLRGEQPGDTEIIKREKKTKTQKPINGTGAKSPLFVHVYGK